MAKVVCFAVVTLKVFSIMHSYIHVVSIYYFLDEKPVKCVDEDSPLHETVDMEDEEGNPATTEG